MLKHQIFHSDSKNIVRGYLYVFWSYFGINGLWVLYLGQKGLSLTEIGLCESIFHLTSFICELPSGTIADRFGYQRALIGGRIAAIVSAVLMLLATNFYGYMFSFIISALSYNLQSGTIDAFMYESLASQKAVAKYPKVIAIVNSLIEASTAVGLAAAGFFVHWHFGLTYWIVIASSLLALLPIMTVEKTIILKNKSNAPDKMAIILKSTGHILIKQKQLLRLMCFQAAFTAIGASYYFYFQTVMNARGLNGIQISLLMLLATVLDIAAVQLTPWLEKHFSSSTLINGLTACLTLFLVSSAWQKLANLVLVYLLINILMAIIEPLFSNYYNQIIPSAQRATLLSAASMLFAISMIVCFPLIGWLIDQFGFSKTFAAIGFILCLLIFFKKIVKNKE